MKVVSVARQLGNLISYKSILENLKNEVKNLQQKRQRVQENLTCWDSEEFQAKSKWLKKIDEFFGQVNRFVNYYEGKSSCTNFLWWYNVNKQARKMMQEMFQLQEEGNLHLLVKPPKDNRAPKSRADIINDIMEALNDPLIQTVGVWWIGGGGTTLLAKQVGEQAKEEQNLFKVVIIDVAEKPSVEQVQEDIEAILGLQFNGEMHVERRNRLRLRIKKEKRILIIIKMWGELNPQEFDLDEIGIPLGDEHKGCKLLLISKSLDFIKILMGVPKAKVFELEVLLEEEAQSLFEKMVGGIAEDSEASSIITEIVKSCECLAPALFAITKVLGKKDLQALQDALMQLKEHVAPIRLCYNSLESEEHKFLLLILTIRARRAVNKHSIYVDMLASLFKNFDTFEAARSRCDSLISDLKAYGFLVEDEKETIKINDLIWHTAYSIAQSDLKASVISTEWRPPEEWLRSLRFCNMTIVSDAQVPERLECPDMQEIILSTDNPSMQVPNSFFDETKLLKVLELISFDCSKLPSSFGLLKNLQALSMYNCKLGDITIVGELTNLQILVFLGSRIQQLPREIGQLQKLLILDLRDTYLQVIPSNVLSNLTSLEELYLRNSFCNWEVERSNYENRNASLKELTNLYHLAYIEDLYVPDPQAWPMDHNFEKPKSYTIFIGDIWGETHDGDRRLKTLKLKLNRRLRLEDGIKGMMKNVDVLYLDELNGVQNVLSDLDSDGFQHLQSLFVQNNAEIKCITRSSSDDHHIDAFSNLESLSLDNVSSLEHICHGSLNEKSFLKIRVIKVQQCHKIKCLFSESMIEGLPHLVDLEVSECKLIEAIVVGRQKIILFPQLRSLTLQGLPALSCFYKLFS
ncbi:probable disease resistance protein At4g27220 [Abrus precatorius]|uniref:Probable disease resistance protein At4g27220 n=1 Tax=Abrus precatorius TaxID=3816 RepID=A0A8B8KFK7_ABRPR|nr:probable disease resistance protein At4g27220 [Abrus precatorius]